jgi:hypothetical protein
MFSKFGTSFTCAHSCKEGQSFYSKLEHHAVRIFLLVLALIAMYKVVLVETHQDEPNRPPIVVPCEPSPTPTPSPRQPPKKKTKKVQTQKVFQLTRPRRIAFVAHP